MENENVLHAFKMYTICCYHRNQTVRYSVKSIREMSIVEFEAAWWLYKELSERGKNKNDSDGDNNNTMRYSVYSSCDSQLYNGILSISCIPGLIQAFWSYTNNNHNSLGLKCVYGSDCAVA